MNIEIKKLTKKNLNKYNTTKFMFDMIKREYNLNYVPQYHKDIMNIDKYYINPKRNNCILAIDTDKDKLVGTTAIRAYDRNDNIKGRKYTKEHTASLFRVFVHPDYRRCKIASKLIINIEKFCVDVGYDEIYLHTQKTVNGALNFWLHNHYYITLDTHNSSGTVHMEKIIASK